MKQPLLSLSLAVSSFTFLALVAINVTETPVFSTLQTFEHQLQAAVYGIASITVADFQSSYHQASTAPQPSSNKVRILIVPGHEPFDGGTAFQGVYEREIVVRIAEKLAAYLSVNPKYDVMVSRGDTAWNPTLASYFTNNAASIADFRQTQTALTESLLASGALQTDSYEVQHNAASNTAALHLYGINKWASENGIDITLHLHINDYGGRSNNRVGIHSGFAVYVPDHQYSNAAASLQVGKAIAGRLSSYHSASTLPQESAGVVEDQELIAIGSNNTADDASVLIEYGYIYEPQFTNAAIRTTALTDYAYETYLGLQDFFNDSGLITKDSTAFPYDWNSVTAKDGESSAGVYALQSALHHLGFYPTSGKSLSDCPISGTVGPCTRAGISAYQSARGLDATGLFGPLTKDVLSKDVAPGFTLNTGESS